MKPPSRLVSLSDMDDFGGIGVPKVLLFRATLETAEGWEGCDNVEPLASVEHLHIIYSDLQEKKNALTLSIADSLRKSKTSVWQ